MCVFSIALTVRVASCNSGQPAASQLVEMTTFASVHCLHHADISGMALAHVG
jgi:hypothetical protein